jgi:hypothetical protein
MTATRYLARAVCSGLLAAFSFVAIAPPSGARAAPGWEWPVHGRVITPYRNGDDPYAGGQHRGIDVAAPVGTPVGPAAAGTVTFAGSAASSGLTVTVRTADGRYDTSYLHLSAIGVRAGAQVSLGERIGAVGTTGQRSASAPHLHFGVRDAGTRQAYHDPLEFLPPPPVAPAPWVPTPAPVAAPAPLRTDPLAVRRPAQAPAPRPLPSPARRPAGHPSPAPVRLPRRLPHGASGTAPVPSAAASAHSAEARRPAARNAGVATRPSLGPATDARRAPSARPSPSHTPGTAPKPQAGPDLGWALACVGLLLAAGLLGGTEDGRAAATRGRARVAAAFRPLLGRQ